MEEATVTALLRTQGWEDASIRIDHCSGRASVLATLGGERWLLRVTEARCMDGTVRQFLTRLEQVYRGGSPPIPRGSGRHGLPFRIHFDDSYLY